MFCYLSDCGLSVTNHLQQINYNTMSTPYFAAISLMLLVGLKGRSCNHVSKGVDFHPISSHGVCRKPILFPNLENIPTQLLCNSKSNFIFSNVPSVCIFTNTLKIDIQKSPILRDVFDLSESTAKEYSKYLYEFNIKAYKCYSVEIASSLAEFLTQAIGLYFNKLTLPLVADTLGNTAANHLLVDGILNVHNAEALAHGYAKYIEKLAKRDMTADCSSKFKVLADSFFEYMSSVDKKISKTAPIATFFYGIGWFITAVNAGCFNP